MTTDEPSTPASGLESLESLEAELDDAELVLACLDRAEPGLCDVCRGAEAAGTLSERPALRACADLRIQASS